MAEYDLLNTPYAERVNARLGELFTVGNNGSTIVDQLIIDSSTMEVRGRIKATAAHTWGKIVWTDYFSIPPVDNEEEIGVSATAYGELLLNLESMSVAAGLRIPLGERSVTVLGKKYSWNFGELRLTANQVKRLLTGDISALTESIPNFGTIEKRFENDYEKTKLALAQKYGAQNVYLARKNPFVDTICPSKGFNYAFSMIVTLGASAPLIMKEVGALALGELASLAQWLASRAVAEAQDIAKTILEGNGVKIPNYFLDVKWTPIEYRSWTMFVNERITPIIREQHGAFYVVIKPRQAGQSQVNPEGFDVGSIGGVDFPERFTLPGEPNTGEPQSGLDIAGWPAENNGTQYRLDIHNQANMQVRIVVLRGTNSPDFSDKVLGPNASSHVHPVGKSERLIGIWSTQDGRLLLAQTLWIDQNLQLFINREEDGSLSLGAIPG